MDNNLLRVSIVSISNESTVCDQIQTNWLKSKVAKLIFPIKYNYTIEKCKYFHTKCSDKIIFYLKIKNS